MPLGQQPMWPAPYVDRGRDLRIDFLRGLCVIAMVIDHVGGASWLYAITGGNRFFTSAAEGFIFVSGLVAGRAYTRFIDRDGLNYALSRVLKRAAQLYLVAVALTLGFVPLSEVLHLPWALGWDLHDALTFVISVVTLHRTYYLVDVMGLYALLLIASPVVLVLLIRGQTLLVLGGSWLLWLLWQVFPDQASVPWPIEGNELFHFSAWQVLFFTGLVMGHHWERTEANPSGGRVARVLDLLERRAWRQRMLRVSIPILAAVIALYAFEDQLLPFVFRDAQDLASAQATLVTTIFGKSDLRPGRVLVFGLVFMVFFLATTEWWTLLRRFLGWLVLPLGQHALFAYAAHVIIALTAAYVATQVGDLEGVAAHERAAIQIGSVLLIWLLVQFKPLSAAFALPRVSVALPAAMGAVVLVALPRYAPDTGQPLAAAPAGDGSVANPSADIQIARAFGTAIPANTQPAVPTAALAPPVQATAVPAPAPAQPSNAAGQLKGKLYEPEFHSAALNTNERFFIYVPAGYATNNQRYPVLYMLHGGGDRREWVNYGLISTVDNMISTNKVPPMIIVLPQGDQSYFVNHQNGPKWGDYMSKDIVPYIDSNYLTLPDAKHRAIGGLSMGGWGALYQAFSHPDEFGVVGAHAASLRSDDGSMSFLPRGDAFKNFDPVQLASSAGITNTHVWLDVDQQDPWLKRDQELHNRLDQRHIANEWHVYPGQHGGSYWHDHLQDYVNFYAHALAS